MLLEKNANPDKGAPLVAAVRKGDLETIKLLISKGAKLNQTDELKKDYYIRSTAMITPLTASAEAGNKIIADALLEYGADINNIEEDGFTALGLAALSGKIDMVRFLIEKGADVETTRIGFDKLEQVIKKLNEQNYAYPVSSDSIASARKILSKYATPQAVAATTASAPVKTGQSAVIAPTPGQPSGSDVASLPPKTKKLNRGAYAVVIGIEQYRQKLPKADYAVNDATAMTEYLTKILGYPEQNVITITNDHATKSDLEKYIEQWLLNNVEKDGTVFVYYSGHGAPNPKTGDAYLVPYDGDPAFIEKTGYSLKRLYENLGKLPAQNIVVALDSCFSGAGGKSVAAKGSRALVRVEKSTAKNIAVLTASADNQISSSYEEKKHGVFTYFLLKGIKGILEEDKFSNLEIGELYDYLKPQVEKTSRKLYNNEQTPQLITADGKMRNIGLR